MLDPMSAMALSKLIPMGIGALGKLFGGGAEKAALKEGWRKMNQLYNYTFPLGKQTAEEGRNTITEGMNTLKSPEQYFTDILSGSRPQLMGAIAPEVNAINEVAQAGRETEGAYGTGRGGGSAAANREAETERQKATYGSIFGARPQAAESLVGIGKVKSEVGLQQFSNALRALGLSQSAIESILQSAGQSRAIGSAENKDFMKDASSSIGGYLGSILT